MFRNNIWTPEGEAAEQAAYVRFEDGERSSERAVFIRTLDQHQILATPPEDVLFLEPGMPWEEVLTSLNKKCPPAHPLLTNRSDNSHQGRVAFMNRDWYAGRSVDEVCEIAQELGEPVQVVDQWYWQGQADDYDAELGEYPQRRRLLNQRGCYLDNARVSLYVVYEPETAERQLKGRDRKVFGATRECPFVTCEEFMGLIREMHEKISVAGFCEYMDHDETYSTRQRPQITCRLKRAWRMFALIYGEKAHYQLPEFKKLAKLWQKKGAATWRSFDTRSRWAHEAGLFEILDEAAALKRWPKKRELKPRPAERYTCPV